MNPKTKNIIHLIISFIGLLTCFTGTILSAHWIAWGLLFLVFLIWTFVLLERMENIRKGWKV